MVRDNKAFYESDDVLPFFFNKFSNFLIVAICKHVCVKIQWGWHQYVVI